MMTSGSTRKPRRGFTLVELLVVVAVIALLIGVLLPALAGARKSSQKVTSAANLRQLAIYKNLYAEDFEEWYPMVYSPVGLSTTTSKSRNPSPEDCAQVQGSYGGYAGFYSLNQKNGKGSTKSVYRKEIMYFWNGTSWVQNASKKGKQQAIMARYMEGPGSYGVLQNPADQADGGENGADFPLTPPEKIEDEYSVAWHNISYLYIAGMKRTDPSLPFLGDETNAVDWGNKQGITFSNYYGSFRLAHPDFTKRGYQDVDNHGDSGGNFAYSDGHVEWMVASKDQSTNSVQPHDRIFGEINAFLRKRNDNTTAVQTID